MSIINCGMHKLNIMNKIHLEIFEDTRFFWLKSRVKCGKHAETEQETL
jgi:hypothetical protein